MRSLKHLFLLSLLVLSTTVFAQKEVTYYGAIESIIINNCAVCHKPGGYGPFPLTTYKEVVNKGAFIGHVVKTRYMPPWKADPEFSSFKNERVLSESDIELVMNWIEADMPKGERTGTSPAIPDLMDNRTPDLVLEMNAPYQLSDESVEDYRFFNIPTNLEEDTYIQSIAYVPGNKQVVHHSRIMADTTNLIRGIDGLSEFDPQALEFQKNPLADEFLYGWVPGNLPLLYPPGTGKKLHANTDLILNIHYAPTSSKQEDRSRIELFFAKEKVDHEIKTLTITEKHITNKPFLLKAETQPTFYVSYIVEEDMNLVSLLPHMHYLGKSFKALAATPNGDAIPLIKIDDWDFNWQSSYLFKEPLFIPRGSTILIVADYDNTSNNPANPNDPVKDVGLGWNSTDEMMNLIFYYY
jgi:hypothetical protein